jgi:hypothetical protein
MKYLVLVVVSAFLGFAGGWLLMETNNTPMVSRSIATAPAPEAPAADFSVSAAKNTESEYTLAYADIGSLDVVFDQLYLAHQLADQASIEQLETLTLNAVANDDPLYNLNIATIFLEKYAALSPQRAMGFLADNRDLDQGYFQAHIMTSWLRNDPPAAIAYLRTASPQLRKSVGPRMLDDPNLESLGLMSELEQIVGIQSVRIAEQIRMRRQRPEELFEESLDLSGRDRQTRMTSAISRWVQQDPEAALRRISELGNSGERATALQIAISQYARLDADAALAYLRQHTPTNTNLELQVLSAISGSDPKGAVPLYEDFVRRTGNSNAMNSLLSNWVRTAPQEAIDFADTLDDRHRAQAYQMMAHSYLNTNPEEAMNWLLTLNDEYEQVRRSALRNINHINVDAAENALAASSDSTARQYLISGIARYRARTQPRTVIDWLATYEKEDVYTDTVRDVISDLTRSEPRLAAELASEQDLPGLAPRIAQSWYQIDATEAVNWARSIDDNQTRNQVFANLISTAVQQDTDRAIELLDEIDSPEVRSNAAYSVAQNWASRRPQDVEEIIGTLQLSSSLEEQIRRYVTGMGDRNSRLR